MIRLFPAKLKNNVSHSRLVVLFVACLSLTACDHPDSVKLKDNQSSAIAAAVNHPARPTADVSRDNIRTPRKSA